MPPKKQNQPSKKTEQKKKEKVIEDKTFGLKNKKGAKQQKYVANVTKQVQTGNVKASKTAQAQEADKKNKKLQKEKELEELNALFRPVKQSVAKGTDPKSVLCQFFKQGQCTKGDKCKFSHDLNIGRKAEKRDLYTDTREDDVERTNLVCKHFLDAVESGGYGWFWTCPNGGDKCTYKHALPEGYVLKKDMKKEDKEDELSIEELIEKERAMLGDNTTKVTLESFIKWKERKRREKKEAFEKEEKEKKSAYKQGKLAGISGRQMFEFDPTIAGEDDEDADDTIDREKDEEDVYEGPVVDVILENIKATDVDASGTQASNERLKNMRESNKLDIAAALPPTANSTSADEQIAMAIAATENGEIASDIPIDEGLFDGDDIDIIDEDLENLDLDED
ncbi:zinc finger CCCH domain-containing protein 15 [Patella vulgata]|uniref:zinc finger CCCH domain-containing protein 15 n=1 Tax=Patella vulgata TaxID=6465 RepID=UPI00217FEF54|nr:zinc finger CCCH domain-containing protein 15 [Patella vulgata]